MKLLIIGASGHGKVVGEIARLAGYHEIIYFDDDPLRKECGGCPVFGTVDQCREVEGDVFVAIGNAKIRQRIMEQYADRNMPVLIHPAAVTAKDISIGRGSVLMPGAIVNPGSVLGQGVIVNTAASVDHDCTIRDYVHVAVGARLCGKVVVGERTWLGAGSILINNLSICGDCMIGAGAVVVRDIAAPGIYYGVPAVWRK